MKKILIITVILLLINSSVGLLGLQLPSQLKLKELEAQLDQSVFPIDEVVEVRLDIPEADFQAILDNPLAEEYKTASVNYNGYSLDNIGVRTKGNSSLSSVARTDSERYSFKLTFNEYVSDQSLSGVTEINLNNNFSDATYMRELLTYELLAEMGVPTPKTSYVNLYINDQLWGLYLAVEAIDEAYLRRNFEVSTGDLYRPAGDGSDLIWKGSDMESYSGMDLKTNRKSPDNAALLTMLEELNLGSDYEKYINVDGFLRYLAVSTAVVNLDSYQGQLKHNYYLYEENGYFHFIPWDFNMSFGGFGGGGMGGGRMPEDGIVEGRMPEDRIAEDGMPGGGMAGGGMLGGGGQSTTLKIDEPTTGNVEERPLISKLLAVEEYKEMYHGYIEEIVNGFLSTERFEARVEEIAELIRPHVEQDPTKFVTMEEFENGIYDTTSGLLAFTEERVENVKQQLSGEIASVKDGTEIAEGAGGIGMFAGGENAGRGQWGNIPQGVEALEGIEGMPQWGGNQAGEAPAGMEDGVPPVGRNQQGEAVGRNRGENAMQPGGEMQGGRAPGGGMGAMASRTEESAYTTISNTTLIMLLLLMTSAFGVFMFKRK